MFDFVIAAISSSVALQVRFGSDLTAEYAALSAVFPFLWVLVLGISGAYDDRYIGTSSDEFRKVLNAGVSLTAGLAILSYAVNTKLSRAYLLLTMPSVTILTCRQVPDAQATAQGARTAAAAWPPWWPWATSPRWPI